jgi:hypothetical protein
MKGDRFETPGDEIQITFEELGPLHFRFAEPT